eukprot:gnl/MRDRNA2_/MRDRNA2_147971_c0_seq1.p1 gnl/MRDRNA2_/MRDRNA2_147971_c0~~gnl/MRDRNA2_/MRDRNA2_147971_c0_seq1.p1  ORF type:complete len:198 (-),score=44.38 gnl/MRDRNA2_/MRDRNA2_147971_c0_seq1:37-564(-)
MAAPLVGLAYYPLALWTPLFLLLSAPSRTVQRCALPITKLFVDSPLAYVLKIVWIVALVLCLDCVRNVFAAPTSTGDAATGSIADALQAAQAKEGALAFALNCILMLGINALHLSVNEGVTLEKDRDIMKKQAQMSGEFAKSLLATGDNKAEKTVPKESKMPEKEDEDDGTQKRK